MLDLLALQLPFTKKKSCLLSKFCNFFIIIFFLQNFEWCCFLINKKVCWKIYETWPIILCNPIKNLNVVLAIHVNAAEEMSEQTFSIEGTVCFVSAHKQHHCPGSFWYCVWRTFWLWLSQQQREGMKNEFMMYLGNCPNSLRMPDQCFRNIGLTWAICPGKFSTQEDSFEFKFKFASHNTSGERHTWVYWSTLAQFQVCVFFYFLLQ